LLSVEPLIRLYFDTHRFSFIKNRHFFSKPLRIPIREDRPIDLDGIGLPPAMIIVLLVKSVPFSFLAMPNASQNFAGPLVRFIRIL
jgi:hypothetical protein